MKNLLLALLFLTVLTMGYLYSQEKGVSARRANMLALQQDSINIQKKAFVINKDLLKELTKENEELKQATKDFKNVESYTKVILLPFTLTMIFLILVCSILVLTPLFFRSLLSSAIRRSRSSL